MALTAKQEQNIEARAEAATFGPWKRSKAVTRGRFTFGENEIYAPDGKVIAWSGFDDSNRTKAQHKKNAQFTAKARDDVPLLLAQLVEERATIEALREEVERLKAIERDQIRREYTDWTEA